MDFGPDSGACLCISTRRGGCSFDRDDLNLSIGTGDENSNVYENRKRIYSALNIPDPGPAGVRQIHSAEVLLVDGSNWHQFTGREFKGDGMVTALTNHWLSISVGDCLAIAIYDPVQKVFSMQHAGWEGTAKRIVENAVHKMREAFGSQPGDLWVVIGPGIGFSSYEVDRRVFDEFSGRWDNWQDFVHDNKGDHGYIDLAAANRWLLEDAGVPASQINSYNLCTHTLPALFFSHRRDGLPGGRMFAFGCMKE